MVITLVSLFFDRKFIYAPFFEMQKVPNHRIIIWSLVLLILVIALFAWGVSWFIFMVPTFSSHCPNRPNSAWCTSLGGGISYLIYPTKLLFYWIWLLMFFYGISHAILTELGYRLPEKEEE